VISNDFYQGWIELLANVMRYGCECAPRGKKVRELLHTQLVVEHGLSNIVVHPVRALNYKFMIAEWLWIAGGLSIVEPIARYNKNIAQFSDDGLTFAGAYGPRLASQWDWLVNVLRKDPDTRQAVAMIWTPCPRASRDIPCTTQVQFLLRAGKLNAVWTMRSNDLWLGLPYDFFNFSQLTNCIAAVLDCEIGEIVVQTGSSHVYEEHYELARRVIDSHGLGECLRSPYLHRWPAEPASMLSCGNHWLQYNDQEAIYAEALREPTKAKALEHLVELSETA
jgi:thymidylate synthase